MNTFPYIADAKILAIPIKENNEPLVDIKDSVIAFGPTPECELTKKYYTKVRASVLAKLCQAQNHLPQGWQLRLYEGFRSLEVQQKLFEQEYQRVQTRYPEKTEDFYFRETTRLVSPVNNLDGSKNIPAHNTGGAIDIEIIDQDGQLIEMGMAAKDWGSVDPEICLTHSKQVSKVAQHNRQILLEVMQGQGFINYPSEWWHFSYGDRYWAYHQPVKQAIYGSADSLYQALFE